MSGHCKRCGYDGCVCDGINQFHASLTQEQYEEGFIPTDAERAANRKAIMALTKRERFELLLGHPKTIMNDTPTPRTDEQINGKPCTRFAIVAGDSLRDAYVSSEFASTLERELTAAREEIEMMGIRYAAREMHTQTIVDESNSVTEQLKNAQAELLKLCLREQLLHDDYKSEKTRADDALLALTAAREESANAKAECLKACLREQLTYEDMRAEKNRADEALLALNQSDLDLKLVTEQRDRLAEAIQKYITEDYSASILTNALKSLNQNAELMAEQAIPDELYDGYAVYQSLTEREKRFTTPENVSAALDAVVRLIKQNV